MGALDQHKHLSLGVLLSGVEHQHDVEFVL